MFSLLLVLFSHLPPLSNIFLVKYREWVFLILLAQSLLFRLASSSLYDLLVTCFYLHYTFRTSACWLDWPMEHSVHISASICWRWMVLVLVSKRFLIVVWLKLENNSNQRLLETEDVSTLFFQQSLSSLLTILCLLKSIKCSFST